jgi:hypothetical protein
MHFSQVDNYYLPRNEPSRISGDALATIEGGCSEVKAAIEDALGGAIAARKVRTNSVLHSHQLCCVFAND